MKLNTSMKRFVITLACFSTLFARPASAQLTAGANNTLFGGVVLIGNDIAYDPVNNIYLSVAAYGPVYGVFVTTAGTPAGGQFTIAAGASFGHYPKTIYCRDLNSGNGGFLVAWHADGYLHSIVVSYPAGVVSSDRIISDGGQQGTRPGGSAGLAYSTTSHTFLATWTTAAFGVQGRFLDASGVPSGAVTQYVDAGGAQEPQVAWNSATDEFGLVWGGFNQVASWVGFRRIPASGGAPSAPTTFGVAGGSFSPSVAINTSTHHYIVGWSLGGGAKGTEFDENGNKIADDRFLASRLGTPTSFSLAFNPISNTFLAVSEDPRSIEVAGVELNSDGSAIGIAVGLTSGATSGSFVPRVTARTTAREWSISYTRNLSSLANQLVSTATTGTGGGGPPPPPPPPAPLRVTGVGMTPDSPVGAGTTVTFTASSTGGTGPIQYQFWRYNYTLKTWTLSQAWSTSNQLTWTPAVADGGWHKVQIWGRSAGGTLVESYADKDVLVQTGAPRVTSFKVSSSSSGPYGYTPGVPVTISALGTGGQTGVLEYEFWRYSTAAGRWSLDRPWSTNTSYNWVPASPDEGVHYLQVWIRDTAHTDWQDWMASELVVSTVVGASISPMTTTVADGGSLPFSVFVNGAFPGYEAKFWRYNVVTGAWTVIRDYSSAPFTWVPTSLDVGQSRVQVWVRPAGSSTTFSAWATTDIINVVPPR